MADSKIKQGTQIVFGVSGTFSPADAGTDWTGGGSITDALTLAGVADGAGRQSAKVDLGTPRAVAYTLLAAVDYTGNAPSAGNTVDYYWAPSTSGTQGTANVAGNSGTDADAPNGAIGSITLSEFLDMCQFIGSMAISDDGAVQNGLVGVFAPNTRYGQLIVVNNGGAAFASDAEMHHVLEPIIWDTN